MRDLPGTGQECGRTMKKYEFLARFRKGAWSRGGAKAEKKRHVFAGRAASFTRGRLVRRSSYLTIAAGASFLSFLWWASFFSLCDREGLELSEAAVAGLALAVDI